MNHSTAIRMGALCVTLVCVGVVGCRGERSDKPPRQFFPGMDDGPRWDPQEQTTFFADGRTMRPSVEGTVAFGRSVVVSEDEWADDYRVERSRMLKEDTRVFTGRDTSGELVRDIPVPIDAELLATGQKKFDIYCAACHGYTGDGLGMVGQRWSYPLPSFHDDKYVNKDDAEGLGTDGHLWNVARYGKYDAQGVQKMPGYAHAIDEYEAWGVVAYLRALQASRRGTLEDVPAQEREILRRQGGSIPQTSPQTTNEGDEQ